ncbi:FtsQ-type POTRA domain-containing protein [Streptomyces thermoviolaceus]|uniref:Cell division protein FtsQ n=1 Tax=Streptomyces thermoviolaceus subsp. thermoviolaceus TaxID=66860 RepID=A0ABX0Z0C6_STRTL|nr:FtsQ-type POTRA domain-containing protein [Streptomyces thermoviolaceus]MCM3265278.1 FtsQ-type POTRA domain-containing protein [Streptomyces thermoviolaceus]NJP16786.1 FtsQ-type POTRA domain-containing protein [Streptomyces thermoviolaceus subsp. thermoviolaceus]WTD49595.1 FtsQ-type POTRA domain-containing protein [Streptomyces thermoviolaceus]GGV62007.1 cell division protein FtsQ [Streptomyces thermoviolaceus subsp. apingens]GHA79067.1 cell division protein FtsQ [Streptomyces thermoviolace
MAGPTTARRGQRQQKSSGRPLRLRRLRRPSPRAVVLSALGVVLLGAAVLWLLYGSPWLRVEHVSVSGTRVLTTAQVREAAQVPSGDPLVSVDTGAVADRVRQRLPRVATVDVSRSWPHGIDVKVVERTAVMVEKKGGKFVEVDAHGVRFATVSRAPDSVPVLELSLSRSPSAAASLRRFGESRLVREAVTVAGDLPAAVSRQARTVKVRTYDDISLELTGGRSVSWGSSEKGRQKARALTALMKAAPHARHFDVSVPTAPASSGS